MLSLMDNNTIAIVLTAAGTFFAGVFGKDGWKYLTRRKEINAEKSCQERLTALEKLIEAEKSKMVQIITGVDLLLVMLEEEYGDDQAHQNVIAKVRTFINKAVEEQKPQAA